MDSTTESQTGVKAIYASLSAVMSECRAITKGHDSKASSGDGDKFVFKYRGIDDVYTEFHPIFARNHIILGLEVIEHHMTDRPKKFGGVSVQHVMKIRFRFTSTIDGSTFESTTVGEASDSGDKGASKAISIGLKYLFFTTFLVPTNDPTDDADDVVPEWAAVEHTAAPSKPATRPSNPPQQPAPAQHAVRPGDFVIHFGKNKGQRLRELSAKSIFWYADTWPITGRSSDEDRALKSAAQAYADELEMNQDPEHGPSAAAEPAPTPAPAHAPTPTAQPAHTPQKAVRSAAAAAQVDDGNPF
jgi:hypothetical protein